MAEPLDLAALERLAALEQAANSAEWITYPNGSEGSPYRRAIAVTDSERPFHSYRIGAFDAHGGRERENADFIVALRNAAPDLLRLARAGLAAEAEIARLRTAMTNALEVREHVNAGSIQPFEALSDVFSILEDALDAQPELSEGAHDA